MPEIPGLSRHGVLPSSSATAGGAEAKLVFKLSAGSAVESLAFSPNRQLMATGAADGTGRLWDITSGTPADKGFFRLDAAVRAFTFASNNRSFAAGSASGVLKLFDLSSGSVKDAGLLRGCRGSVEALAFSPDCTLIAAGGADQTLRIWEPGKGIGTEPRTQLPGHTQAIHAIAFAADGNSLATGSADATARIWALNRIRPGQQISFPHTGDVFTVAFAPDGRTLATSGKDQVIWLWDVTAAKATVRARLAGHQAGTRLLLFSADGETVVSVGGVDVMNWSPRSGRLRNEWSLPAGAATRFALTADGRYLARGSASGTVELFRVADKRK